MMKKEIEIAPMLDWTDSFFRQFIRQITKHAPVYTEMIAEKALCFGDKDKLLTYQPTEQPIILQVGGSDEKLMTKSAIIAQNRGFKEVNINAGCPSQRVQNGSFGACLMATPEKIAQCVKSMQQAVDIPITIKTRIALETPQDKTDGFDNCCRFVEINAKAGCKKFIIHARKARLKGFSPKENRQKLPLNYEVVYKIKEAFPELLIYINGDIRSKESINQHLLCTDGVMIGRWAYANPFALSFIDPLFYNDNRPLLSRAQIIKNLLPTIAKQQKPLHLTRHLMGLFFAQNNSKEWKQAIMKNSLSALEEILDSL